MRQNTVGCIPSLAGLCWPLDGSGAELPSRSEERVRYCFQFPSLVHYRFHPHSLPYAVLYLSGQFQVRSQTQAIQYSKPAFQNKRLLLSFFATGIEGLLLPNPGSPSRKSHIRLFDFNLPLSRPGQSASSSEDLLGPARFSHYLKSLSYIIWIRAFPLRSSACRSKVIGEAAGGKSLFITPLSPEPPGKTLGLQSADECLPSYPLPLGSISRACLSMNPIYG